MARGTLCTSHWWEKSREDRGWRARSFGLRSSDRRNAAFEFADSALNCASVGGVGEGVDGREKPEGRSRSRVFLGSRYLL